MLNIRLIFLFFLLQITYQSAGQVYFSEINYSKIKQKKIQKFLSNQEHEHKTLLEIEPSLKKDSDIEGYRIEIGEYFVKGSLEKVWQHYLNTNPSDSWNCKKVTFGMLFSKKDKKLIYNNESVSKLDTGQVIFLNLKLMSGLTNIAAVFEFISIDVKRKILEFSYIKGNTTEGKQQLEFVETRKGDTQIIHTSYYKSSSILRDRLLYPYFHTRITNEFHRNMKKRYRNNEKLVNQVLSTVIAIP